ncbi:MAG: DUF1343 domain-containing protein [Bacteroidota bacterium]|nr:DUF1343 domain-containing protein [Bacteroidota bacterium]
MTMHAANPAARGLFSLPRRSGRGAAAVLFLICTIACTPVPAQDVPAQDVPAAAGKGRAPVMPGCEVLLADSLHLLAGRRVGLLCNHTSRLRNGSYLYDTLRSLPRVTVTALFSPEHGFRGSADAGEHVQSASLDGIPLHSLYGGSRRPTAAMLENIDVLVMDLQDIGARYYTYVSTMMYCIEAAAEAGVEVVLLDRPNPIGGDAVSGPIRADSMRSFVSLLPVPVRHGMTAGELARMAVGEGWLRGNARHRLTVIPMHGWRRSMYYDDTRLPWVSPSPNIVSVDAALAYVGTCLLEGSSLSEGRGTESPFLLFGAPFVDGDRAASELNALSLPGVIFQSARFVPRSRPGASHPRFEGQECGGVRMQITDRSRFPAWRCGVEILRTFMRLHDGKITCTPYLSLLAGTASFCSRIRTLQSPEWDDGVRRFLRARTPYLLYH